MNEKHRRLTTLLAFLQIPRGKTVSRERITESVGGYTGSDEAIRKKLQRDLKELEVACDLVVEYDASVDGYRVRRRPLTLKLDAAELAALALVARMLGPDDRAGLSLEAMGAAAPVDPGIRAPVEPDPKLAALIEAISNRRVVRFAYRKPDATRAAKRSVLPWRIIYRGGWYLAGYDTGRKAKRTFKLSRMPGDIEVGEAVAYEIPTLIDDIREPWALGDGSVARLRARDDVATMIARRLRGRIVERDEDTSTIEAPYADDAAFAPFLAGFGSSIVVLEPASLREAIVAHLAPLRERLGARS